MRKTRFRARLQLRGGAKVEANPSILTGLQGHDVDHTIGTFVSLTFEQRIMLYTAGLNA